MLFLLLNPYFFLYCFALLKICHISHRRSSSPPTPSCACRSGLSPHKLGVCTLYVIGKFLRTSWICYAFLQTVLSCKLLHDVLCMMKEESTSLAQMAFFGPSCALVWLLQSSSPPCLGLYTCLVFCAAVWETEIMWQDLKKDLPPFTKNVFFHTSFSEFSALINPFPWLFT